MLRRTVMMTVLCALMTLPLSAQSRPSVDRGARVRLWLDCVPTCRRVTGTLTARTSDSLWLRVDQTSSTVAIPAANVRTMQIAAGRESRAGLGAGVGAMIGAVLGAVIGNAVDPPDPQGFLDIDFGGGLAGFFVGGGAGALIGLGVGAQAGPERWVNVSEPGFNPRRSGSGPIRRRGRTFLSWSIRF